MKNMKRNFLVFAFVAVTPIALAYGVSPDWFASTFLGIETLDTNIAHILRAIMCLYLALGLFWLYSAFNEAYRNAALLTVVLFTAGLVNWSNNQLFRRWSASTASNPIYWIRVSSSSYSLLGLQIAGMITDVCPNKRHQ